MAEELLRAGSERRLIGREGRLLVLCSTVALQAADLESRYFAFALRSEYPGRASVKPRNPIDLQRKPCHMRGRRMCSSEKEQDQAQELELSGTM